MAAPKIYIVSTIVLSRFKLYETTASKDHRAQPTSREYAKLVLLKLATYYNYIPALPDDTAVVMIESRQTRTLLQQGLIVPGNNDFIVLVDALQQMIPNQEQLVDANDRLPLHFTLHSGLGAPVRRLAARVRRLCLLPIQLLESCRLKKQS